MRLIACAFSAVLLSGCSWLGMGGASKHGQSQYGQGQYGAQYSGRYGQSNGGQFNKAPQARGQNRMGPCQIQSPMQPIPAGCRPEQVTLALGNGSGQPAGGQYTSGGYGSHAGNAHTASQRYQPQKTKRRPLLRGSLGLELDHSVGGTLYDTAAATLVPGTYINEGFNEGTNVDGTLVTTSYTTGTETTSAPSISFDDVYNAPFRVTGGLEFIMSDHATVFANAGYTRAEGSKGGGADIIATAFENVTTENYDAAGNLIGTPSTNSTFVPNQVISKYNFEFNELERIDLEAGGRYYFNPIMQDKLSRTLTPFVAASGGAAYYSETTVRQNEQRRYLGRIFDGSQVSPDGDFYSVGNGAPTQIYDAQWVPYGALRAGVEWQMTPKTALAFEAGLKYEGARDSAAGVSGDDNLSMPLAIRGSYNF